MWQSCHCEFRGRHGSRHSHAGVSSLQDVIVVVNRALPALHGKIVVAEVNGEFTVKQFWRHKGAIQLRAGNKTFPPYIFKDGETLAICGVVTWGVRKYG